MFKPRLYQIEAVKSVEGKNGIIVCPTGSGKSVIIAEICKKLLGKILILQPSLEILNQNATKIINATNEEIGVYSASAGKKTISRITLATIQSIKDKNLFIDYKNVICDEAHLVNAKGGKYQELIDFIKPKYLIGLTATPYRMFQTKLYGVQYRLLWNTRPKIFKKLLYVYQNYEIYKDGYWSKIKYFQYKYNENGLIKNKFNSEN
jgi:DNA repair protein RadD